MTTPTLEALRDALAKATHSMFVLDVACAELLTDWNSSYGPPPAYTASVDAAVGLVPEECGCRMMLRSCGVVLRRGTGAEIEVKAANLPLALCLARVTYELEKARE